MTEVTSQFRHHCADKIFQQTHRQQFSSAVPKMCHQKDEGRNFVTMTHTDTQTENITSQHCCNWLWTTTQKSVEKQMFNGFQRQHMFDNCHCLFCTVLSFTVVNWMCAPNWQQSKLDKIAWITSTEASQMQHLLTSYVEDRIPFLLATLRTKHSCQPAANVQSAAPKHFLSWQSLCFCFFFSRTQRKMK